MWSDLPSMSCQLFAKYLSKNASAYGVATYVCSPLLKSAPPNSIIFLRPCKIPVETYHYDL